ncbi:MAG TPA: ribosome maturation factor RimM [Actinomycetota bacterium]|nr:ribosome maturation factor RimM [Actinomycetota bacterium]
MLLAGEIGKPHGLAGEVYVVVISDDPRRFEPGARLHHADGRILTVETARHHRDRFLVKFEGIEDREGAAGLRGALYVGGDEVRDLEEDEYWLHDIVGCDVMTTDGATVGRVSDVINGPAQDLLEVATSDGPRLVPVVKDILVSVDVVSRRVVIDPPEGLL